VTPHPSLRGLVSYFAVQAFLSAAFLNYFCRAFDIDRTLILVHLPLVFVTQVVALLIPGLLLLIPALRGHAAVRVTLGLTTGLVGAALALLYVADLISYTQMGSNVTHKLVGLWAWDWWHGGNLLNLSPIVGVSAIAGTVAIIGVHLWHSAHITDGLLALTATRARTLITLTMLTVLVSGSVVAGRDLARRTPRSELLSSDPILAFLRTSVDVYDARYLEETDRLRAEEPRTRAAYPKDIPFTRRNVIVIIIDSLRADHLPAYGYFRPTTPFLTTLQASGHLRTVEFVTSTCAESNCGIISTLSSKHLRRQISESFKINDLLSDQGYATYFILSGNHDWRNLESLYGTGQTIYFDGRQSTQFGRSDDRVIFEGLQRVPDDGGPAFFFFHLMSAHLVGTKQDGYRVYHPSDVKNDWGALFGGEYDTEAVVNNYDNGVTQADAVIEELFTTLDRKGYLKDSLVVITSDHGEGLGESERTGYGHVTSLYQEFIRIPLLIYDPLPIDYGNTTFATQIDIAPTILDRLGLPVPHNWEGTSLLTPLAPRTTFHQTALKSPLYALIRHTPDATYKYISGNRGRREELYNLTTDPGERANLRSTADPALLTFFRDELKRRLEVP